MRRSEKLPSLAFILGSALAAHLLFSWMGFNPTDDGFTLAYSRRLLNGQIPHLDFISIRPLLSPLLHAPIVWLGGEYTLWLSRFVVWLEIAAIAWIWTGLAARAFGYERNTLAKASIGLICLAAAAHTFPIMAWHTIDGLLLGSLGLWLIFGKEKLGRWWGYFILGTAYLCKQNFLALALAALLVTSDWCRLRYWAASALPGVLYLGSLAALGGLSPTIRQVLSQNGFLTVGVIRYLVNWLTWIGLGLSLGLALYDRRAQRWGRPRWPAPVLVAGITLATVLIGLWPAQRFASLAAWDLPATSVLLFALVAGLALGDWWPGTERNTDTAQLLALAAAFAWGASISLGYKTPTLGAAGLVALSLGWTHQRTQELGSRWGNAALLLAVPIILLSFYQARQITVYRDLPADQLTCRRDGILPGGRLIRSNPVTCAYLAELNELAESLAASGERYAILPANAAYWVQSAQANPLPIDWIQATELSALELLRQVEASLDTQRGQLTLIVQSVQAHTLVAEVLPLDEDSDYAIVRYIQNSWNLTESHQYFDLYH